VHVASLLRDPSLPEGVDEWLRAPVHDRRFGSAQFDHDVVELAREHGRQHMLHRVYGNWFFSQLRPAFRKNGVFDARRD
jgi:hypothetical protein